MQAFILDLYNRDTACYDRFVGSEQVFGTLSMQLFAVEQTLASLGEVVGAGGKKIELTQEQLLLLRDSITKMQQELRQKEDLAAKIAHYLDTQVKVITREGSGSGTLLAGGYVLTAAHVIHEQQQISAQFGTRVFQARVIKFSADYDLALLKLDTVEKLPYAKLEDMPARICLCCLTCMLLAIRLVLVLSLLPVNSAERTKNKAN